MPGLSALAARTLATLIDPAHLQPAAMAAARTAFGAGANRHLVLDRFLAPALLPRLRQVVEGDGVFEDNLKLASASRAGKQEGDRTPRGKVDADAFRTADAADRFIFQQRLVGPKPGSEGSAAWKAERFVRTMFASQPMHEWLAAVTGLRVTQTGGINLKLHGPGHFLKPHSDAREGRQVCAVLYLHRDWEDAYGGRFVLYLAEGGEKRIDPLPNRLILFEASDRNFHAIEPLGDPPAGWLRINYTVWFA